MALPAQAAETVPEQEEDDDPVVCCVFSAFGGNVVGNGTILRGVGGLGVGFTFDYFDLEAHIPGLVLGAADFDQTLGADPTDVYFPFGLRARVYPLTSNPKNFPVAFYATAAATGAVEFVIEEDVLITNDHTDVFGALELGGGAEFIALRNLWDADLNASLFAEGTVVWVNGGGGIDSDLLPAHWGWNRGQAVYLGIRIRKVD
ncbi:MAG: hypothetical protein AB1405_05485 [Bdellovibrionota bacterium]